MAQSQFDMAHALEQRMLLAGIPLTVVSRDTSIGVELTIDGTPGADSISLHRRNSTLLISTSSGWTGTYTGRTDVIQVRGLDGNDKISVSPSIWTPVKLYGDGGNDTLIGGSGSDSLFGGSGRDALYGGAGDDTIVSVGASRNDRISGGAGLDSFWVDSHNTETIADAGPDELAAGTIHRIESFLGVDANGRPAAIELTRSASSYADFSDQPLFSRWGPLADDIEQGALGDCYLLASLGSLANANPQVIRQSIADLGDGTFAVRFKSGTSESYVRVDGRLPALRGGEIAYAQLGRQRSTWVALFEKAYAVYRTGESSYASLEGGFMSDVFEDLGLQNESYFRSGDGANVLERLKRELDAGDAVTVGTRNRLDADLPILAGHAYVLERVLTDSSGRPVAATLRNPWAEDGKGDDGADDGLVTVTAEQLSRAFWFSCAAEV